MQLYPSVFKTGKLHGRYEILWNTDCSDFEDIQIRFRIVRAEKKLTKIVCQCELNVYSKVKISMVCVVRQSALGQRSVVNQSLTFLNFKRGPSLALGQ